MFYCYYLHMIQFFYLLMFDYKLFTGPTQLLMKISLVLFKAIKMLFNTYKIMHFWLKLYETRQIYCFSFSSIVSGLTAVKNAFINVSINIFLVFLFFLTYFSIFVIKTVSLKMKKDFFIYAQKPLKKINEFLSFKV